MKRHVLIFGLVGGVLVTLLKLIEYRFLVIEHSLEIYGGLIALTFAVLGIWLGIQLATDRGREGDRCLGCYPRQRVLRRKRAQEGRTRHHSAGTRNSGARGAGPQQS